MGLLLGICWLAFWVWVLKGIYRAVTRGIGRAFNGTWDTMFGNNSDVASWQRATYEVRSVENAPVTPQAALSAAPVTGDLEWTLRQEEDSATALARTIGENRNAIRQARKQAEDWRAKAETAVGVGRDDLARQALAAAQKADDSAMHAEAVIAELQPILDSYEVEIDGLRHELEEGKRRQLVANARIERAQASQRAARFLTLEGQQALDRANEAHERRADFAEGQVEAEKIGTGFGRKGLGASQPPGKKLAATLTPLESAPINIETEKRWDAAIEKQLVALKARRNDAAA